VNRVIPKFFVPVVPVVKLLVTVVLFISLSRTP
jgi:hypothetical protein